MNNNEALGYYQSRPKQAFMDGFVGDTSFEAINETVYRGLKFYIPTNSRKRVKFLKKYFAFVDAEPQDPEMRRRLNYCEFAETAVTILQRIDSFLTRNHIFVAGSAKVCQIPWAIFGKTEKGWSQNKFECMVDISRFYSNFLHGKCYPLQLHFKNIPNGLFKLADRFNKFPLNNPNFWMGVALNLMYDLIHNCAPDCPEVFELFTNDYRLNSESIPDDYFEDLRCKILGIHPDPLKNLPKVNRAEFKPKRMKTEIIMLCDEIDDLALGEKTAKTAKPMLCLMPAKKDYKQEGLGPRWPGPPYKMPLDLVNASENEIPHDMRDIMMNPYLSRSLRHNMAGLMTRMPGITPDML